MANLNIKFNFQDFAIKLLEAFQTKFGDDFAQIVFYPLRDDDKEGRYEDLALPAIFLDMHGAEGDEDLDQSTEQLGIKMMFSACILFAANSETPQLKVRGMALAVAQFIHKSYKFNSPVNPGKVDEINPDIDLMMDNERFCAWTVTWTHNTLLGDSVFDIFQQIPTEHYLSFAPKIGADNIDDYEKIE